MRVLAATAENIAEVAAMLRRGELAAIPTETVYGLAGLATDDGALAQIFAAKDRPTFDPLIVHVPAARARLAALEEDGLVSGVASAALVDRLLAAFWPGPLTLVLPRGPRVPDLAASGLPTVAVRSPRHPVAQALLDAAGPLAAPSANRFGRISPTSAADVVAELSGRVPVVLDGGPCAVGLESTIVAVDEAGLRLLRPGGAPAEAIEAVAGTKLVAGGEKIAAPGMLPGHYAPRKRLVLLDGPVASGTTAPAGRLAALLFDPDAAGRLGEVAARVLGPTPEDAARGLFAALRALDACDADLIVAEPCPWPEGLGHAIRDRLARAAHGSSE